MESNKDLVLYYCAKEDESTREIVDHLQELVQFANMLGQEGVHSMYVDDGAGQGEKQDKLQEALEECRSEDSYLLCYDIDSLSPDRDYALDIIDSLTEEMLFVMFVDDESTLKTIEA